MKNSRVSALLATLAFLSAGVQARSQTADSFAPQPDNDVNCLALQPDGKAVVAGYFKNLAGFPRPGFGRLNADGTLDAGFAPTVGSDYCVAIQPDGKILAPIYSSAGFQIARLDAEGGVQDRVSLDIDSEVRCLSLQPDGKVLAGGFIGKLGGRTLTNICRLNRDWSVDSGFKCWANSVIYCAAQQENGQILIGGDFTVVNGQTETRICRLNADGSLDGSFRASANGMVFALAVQPEGKVLVGGYFTNLDGQFHTSIGRLNPDGSFDTNFQAALVDAAGNHNVTALALQADGRILVGGSFGILGGGSASLCRLNPDGTLDDSFVAAVSPSYGGVDSLALQPDGRIVVAGSFGSIGGQPRRCMGRLNNTAQATQSLSFGGGTITWVRGGTSPEVWRTTFATSSDGGRSWTKLGDGTRIPGGWQLRGLSLPSNARIRARGFTANSFVEALLGPPLILENPVSLTNNAGSTATFAVYTGGTAPLTYQWRKNEAPLPSAANVVGAQTPTLILSKVLGADQGNYCLVISNAFGRVTSTVATLTVLDPIISVQPSSVVRQLGQEATFAVSASGTPPFRYQWRKNGGPLAGARQPSLILTNLQPTDAASYDVIVSTAWGSATSHVALLTINLAPADSFSPTVLGQWGGNVSGLAVQPDGRILVSGSFYSIAGQFRTNLARLNSNGTLDANFDPAAYGFNGGGPVLLEPDGHIVASGSGLVRLDAGGVPDMSFAGGGGGSLELLPSGKFLAGGLYRFNPDGTLDLGFTPVTYDAIPKANRGNVILTTAAQPDGKILIGGYYTFDWGVEADFGFLVRVDTQGKPDTNFNAAVDLNLRFPAQYSHVESVALQADGKILVGGSFSRIGGQFQTNLARLNRNGTADMSFRPNPDGDVSSIALQANGKIVIGGWFTTIGGESRSNLARLFPDGTVDPTFNPGDDANWSGMTALALQNDGKLLVGGTFTTLAAQPRADLGRLSNNEAATQELTFDGSALTWLRGGSSPEVWAAKFAYTLDGGASWTELGRGARIPGGWRLTEIAVPAGAAFRARGYLTSGVGNACSSLVESFTGKPGIYTQPLSITKNAGSTADFYVHAGADGLSTFQWRKDGTNLADGANVSGALSDHLTLTGVLQSDSGEYSAVFTYAGRRVTSSAATLTVIDPAINIQPLNQITNIGCAVALQPAAAGTPPLYFQWFKDDAAKAGATQQGLVLTNLQPSDAGAYVLIVSNAFGTAISTTAVVTVQAPAADPLNPGAYGSVLSLALEADGTILAAGDYGTFEQLSPDGEPDRSFNPKQSGGNSVVNSLAVTPDGKIWAAGSFNSILGKSRANIAAINPGGRLGNFNPAFLEGQISTLLAQPDGKIIVGGYFLTAPQEIENLARFNPDVTIDRSFDLGMHDPQAQVSCLLYQPDGRILVAGKFAIIAGQARTNLARLNPDGTLDTDFRPDVADPVTSLALQADERILVATSSTSVFQSKSALRRLNPDGTLDTSFDAEVQGPYSAVRAIAVQTDGGILIGGYFTTINGQTWGNLGRLKPDGSLDASFSPQAGGAYLSAVDSLALQPDGRIVVGGYFGSLAGQYRTNIGRLDNNEPATQSLTFDGSTITWLRGGASPEIRGASFQYSLDGHSWVDVGDAKRIPGGWQLTGIALPAASTLRAGGFVQNGSGSWYVESSIPVGAAGRPYILQDSSLGFGPGGFGFQLMGAPGQVVVVESSEDLINWTTLATNTLGPWPQHYSDSRAPAQHGPRFYRLHLAQ